MSLEIENLSSSSHIDIQDFNVDLNIHQFIAEFTITISLYNTNSNDEQNINLKFPLGKKDSVSGYSIEFNENEGFIDGSIVEKKKARKTFDAETRKGKENFSSFFFF